MTSPFDEALPLALGAHNRAITIFERQQATAIRQAYRRARTELVESLESAWRRRFGDIRPERQQVLVFLSDPEVRSLVDRVMLRLNLQTRAAQEQAWHGAASLGFEHTRVETAALVDFFGGIGGIGRTFFGSPTINFDAIFLASLEASDGLDLDLRRAVQKTLLEGGLAGEGITKLRRRLLVVRQIGENRADVAVRWAVMRGYNASRFFAYEQAAQVLPGIKKVWATANDDRVCPHCSAQHGQVLELQADFDPTITFAKRPLSPYGGVLRFPPLHPRCRCTLLPWFDRWDGLTTVSPADMRADAQRDSEVLFS